MKPPVLTSDTFFDGIHQKVIEDYQARLPIFYFDNTSLTAIFSASTRKVRSRLPFDTLHPVELYPGRCLVAISAFQYRESDIGPYNEFSLAALVSQPKKGLPLITAVGQLLRNEAQAYILSLPVDSEIARRGGVEMSGYPKFLAEFKWTEDAGYLCCEVNVNGRSLVKMRGRKLSTSKGRITRTILYTKFEDRLLMANLYVDPKKFAQSIMPESAAVEVGEGHELCETLMDLELGKTPLAYQYSPYSRAMLFDSKNLLDA
ncbi:MAG: acetoacetate decarboxylase family protein [Deltaproteobacteria bacterium]|nr:acetoacetate decarboxylase family protein [Deltaproteobacteria bacterium]